MSHIFGPDDFALGKKGPIKREVFSPLPLKVKNFGKIRERGGVIKIKKNKVNRCLARYSPCATTTSQPIMGTPNEPAMVRNANFGLNLVVFEQKILFLLEKSKVLLPT